MLISKISLKITTQCNIQCSFCHQSLAEKKCSNIFIDYDTLYDFLLKQTFTNKVGVTLSGGEPTLYPKEILKAISIFNKVEKTIETKFRIAIITNGTNMPIIYKWLEERVLNPSNIAISWEGIYSSSKSRKILAPQYNDTFFNNIIQELGKTNYSDKISIRMAITPHTIDSLFKSMKYCIENNCTRISYYYIHEADYSDEGFIKSFEKQINLLYSYIADCLNNNKIVYFNNWDMILNKSNDLFYTCDKLKDMIHIDTKGDIYPCMYFGDHYGYKLGDIYNGVDLRKVEELNCSVCKSPDCDFKNCKCYQCSECIAANYVHNKSVNKRFKNCCYLYQIEKKIFDKIIFVDNWVTARYNTYNKLEEK